MSDEAFPLRPRRRATRASAVFRTRRIHARLREGSSYEDIAFEEGLSVRSIRQIVADWLKERPADSHSDHARLQLARLEPALKLAGEAIGDGDVGAITAYLKVLDRFDRYQTAAQVHQVYDDEARQKLLQKLNFMAANLAAEREEEKAEADGEAPAELEPAEAEDGGENLKAGPDDEAAEGEARKWLGPAERGNFL